MRRAVTMLAATLLALGLYAGPALGEGHGGSAGPPDHAHMLIQRPVIEPMDIDVIIGGEVVTIEDFPHLVDYRRCVDIVGGSANARSVHHHTIHQGMAGAALTGRAGHQVVPTSPLSGFGSCADAEAAAAQGPVPFGPLPGPPA